MYFWELLPTITKQQLFCRTILDDRFRQLLLGNNDTPFLEKKNSYSNIWFILLRLGIHQILRFKEFGSGKHCCNTVAVSNIMLYQLISLFSNTDKLRLGGIAKTNEALNFK